ncbi:MAG: sugar phosphate isomerase/epimerase family protein [Tepidisphaerales bacterium]
MTRRDVIKLAAAGSAAALAAAPAPGPQTAVKGKWRMGGTSTAFSVRSSQLRAAGKQFDQLEHCHSLGMGGVEVAPPSFEPADVKAFRAKLESYGMYLSANALRLPNDKADLPAFEKIVQGYAEAGAKASRCPQTQRRYEQYKTLDDFKKDFARCKRQVELAEPVARRYRLKIGIENHKGQRFGEFVDWIKGVGSEWVGITFDVGNNYSLCDDPMEWLPTIAPLAVNVHIKDMALGEYPDGFLLAEVPLGQGIMDMAKIVNTIRGLHPDMTFGLEMITRDPLQIPVYTEQYWETFKDPSSPLPGRDLAHILNLVRTKGTKNLQFTSKMSPAEQLKAEDDNIAACIRYARENLGL